MDDVDEKLAAQLDEIATILETHPIGLRASIPRDAAKRLRELAMDKARLDFMESYHCDVGYIYGRRHEGTTRGWYVSDQAGQPIPADGESRALRDALDAAMADVAITFPTSDAPPRQT